MNTTIRIASAALALFSLVACDGTKSSSEASSSLASTSDNRGNDITVLQAWLGQTVMVTIDGFFGGDLQLARTACPIVRDETFGSGTVEHHVQCDREIEQKARLSGFTQDSPLVNEGALYTYGEEGPNHFYAISGECELVEMRTVLRDAALNAATFTGVGFYLAGGFSTIDNRSQFFVAKDRLHAVGHVRLADGAPATVHRFIARGSCFETGGNGDSLAHRHFELRPFAQYGEGGNDFKVWDQVPADYKLGFVFESPQSHFVQGFDRQNELLLP